MTSSGSVVTFESKVASLLSNSFGGDLSDIDAITGALAETHDLSKGGVFGDLLHAAWVEQVWQFRNVSAWPTTDGGCYTGGY